MHRPTIGLIAVVLLIAGFVLRGATDEGLSAACFRIGVVMALVWLAHPQLENMPRWLVFALCATALVVMRWPRLLVLALPVAVVLWLLRPRPRRTHLG